MRVVLIGASGFTGAPLLTELLSRGHQVTAVVRNREKITQQEAGLQVQAMDATNTNALAAVIKGHDAVLSAFNPGWETPDLYNVFLKGAEAIEAAVTGSGVKRFLVIGGAGSLYISPGVQLVDTPDFPEAWKAGATAARDYYQQLKNNTTLDWTFLSPAIELFPGPRTGQYRTATDTPVLDEHHKSRISNADLAVALADELEQGNFIRQRFTVGY
jgi:putative NADH-flavin reductase